MKNVLPAFIVISFALLFSGCEKCYTCHNYCKVCREVHTDTTLTIIVQSDVFTEQYFTEYLDSLNSLGWTCGDTSSTKSQEFCGTKSQNDQKLINKKEAGWICAPE
ncbi:MAG: hypothetical protein U0T75_07170 [Chitinophagales bacterium]